MKYMSSMCLLRWGILGVFFFLFLRLDAQVPLDLSQSDVDSIGDLWIFTLDKTGSMLSERTVTGAKVPWTSKQIKRDVMGKLSRDGGVLDQIDYNRDRIIVLETGYGNKNKKDDSYGHVFRAAPSLDSSFVHVVSPLRMFRTNGKRGFELVLGDLLEANNYNYRESFVSQIRVLSLHRIVTMIREKKMGLTFRKIHIVTITDDADVNDQWKMDYYTIKRDPRKMEYLNNLHSKYVYSSFTQKGGGYLEEREFFTDVSSKNHIYVYDYITQQQRVDGIICGEDYVLKLSPMDGTKLDFALNQKFLDSDSICFVYVDTVSINGIDYLLDQYIAEECNVNLAYEMDPVSNDIVIRGKLQVQYQDSIYGLHYKSFPFVQVNDDYTASVHFIFDVIEVILAVFLLLFVLYVLWILPNRKLLKVILSDGRQLHVRHGYRWQWERLVPLVYANDENVIFAKHSCFKRKNKIQASKDNPNLIVIDSPVPLVITGDLKSDTTKNNILRNARGTYNGYPDIVQTLYKKTLAGRIAHLQNSSFRWVRLTLYPILNRLIFCMEPHYYYWGAGVDGLVSSSRLLGRHFLLEYKKEIRNMSHDDCWINMYYQGDFPVADILVCLDVMGDTAVWDVYQLANRKYLGYGIGSVKHLVHYCQNKVVVDELGVIQKRLIRAIAKEVGAKRIVCLDKLKQCMGGVAFDVSESTHMSYICLVENSVEGNCQIIYSPFTDSEAIEKNVVLKSSKVSRLLWISLLPFESKKDRVASEVARSVSLDVVREGATCQKSLCLKSGTIVFDNIIVNP